MTRAAHIRSRWWTHTVQDRADDGAQDLHRERDPWRELAVLAELQVPKHEDALVLRVLPVQRPVHVRDRVPGHEVRRDHLVERVRGRVELEEANRRRERGEQQRHRRGDQQDDGERPPGQA